MKINEDLKFRFIDSNLSKDEIKSLTKKDWEKLYNYQVKRDSRIINGIYSLIHNGLIKFVFWMAVILFVIAVVGGISLILK